MYQIVVLMCCFRFKSIVNNYLLLSQLEIINPGVNWFLVGDEYVVGGLPNFS